MTACLIDLQNTRSCQSVRQVLCTTTLTPTAVPHLTDNSGSQGPSTHAAEERKGFARGTSGLACAATGLDSPHSRPPQLQAIELNSLGLLPCISPSPRAIRGFRPSLVPSVGARVGAGERVSGGSGVGALPRVRRASMHLTGSQPSTLAAPSQALWHGPPAPMMRPDAWGAGGLKQPESGRAGGAAEAPPVPCGPRLRPKRHVSSRGQLIVGHQEDALMGGCMLFLWPVSISIWLPLCTTHHLHTFSSLPTACTLKSLPPVNPGRMSYAELCLFQVLAFLTANMLFLPWHCGSHITVSISITLCSIYRGCGCNSGETIHCPDLTTVLPLTFSTPSYALL